MAIPAPKRRSYGLEIKTARGKTGISYVVFKTYNGTFHAFMEVDAKAAANDCGGPRSGNTQARWNTLWKKP